MDTAEMMKLKVQELLLNERIIIPVVEKKQDVY